jgi:hypothetical protein
MKKNINYYRNVYYRCDIIIEFHILMHSSIIGECIMFYLLMCRQTFLRKWDYYSTTKTNYLTN